MDAWRSPPAPLAFSAPGEAPDAAPPREAASGESQVVPQQYDFEDVAAGVELVVGEVEGGQQADHVVVGAVDQQLTLQALVHDRRAGAGKLDADHHAFDADVLDQRA